MTTAGKVVLVAAGIAATYGLYVAGARTYAWMKGPEPGSRGWQIQQFRKDWRACGQFASKREEARKLLAWKPKRPWVNPPGSPGWKQEWDDRLKQDLEESRANLKNFDGELKPMAARFEADEVACLRDMDWPDVRIESLRKAVAECERAP